jgi:hypothetical protein
MPCTPAQLRALRKYRAANLEKENKRCNACYHKKRETDPEYVIKYRYDDKMRKRIYKEFRNFLLILLED